jgi:hypothetical protein
MLWLCAHLGDVIHELDETSVTCFVDTDQTSAGEEAAADESVKAWSPSEQGPDLSTQSEPGHD